ncbi:TetR/AcrR family transcriptional regulator [Myceligenerans cantabricum]
MAQTTDRPGGPARSADIDIDRLPPAGRRILATASDLFYARGIGAVGVEAIALEAGVTKKTLYDRFGSKEGLATAYLRNRCAAWQAYLAEYLDASPATGAGRVLVPLDALAEWMRDHDRGCGFVNAYAELAGTGHAGLAVITQEKTMMRETYVRLVAEAGKDRPQERGTALAIVHEGVIVQSTAGGLADAVRHGRALAALVLAEGSG